MIKKILCLLLSGLLFSFPAFAGEMADDELIKELKALKERTRLLEEKLSSRPAESTPQAPGDQSLAERISHIEEELTREKGGLGKWADKVTISALVEAGGVYQDVDCHHDDCEADDDQSDISLTTVEIGLGVEVNDWVNLELVYLYEDPSFGEETSVDLDVGAMTIGNTGKFPFYLTIGKMFVPFGALLTHFPDDPLIDQPVTLCFAETSEKAVLAGFEHSGFAVSGYAFNGDVDEEGANNSIESFGFDANYTFCREDRWNIMVGASYLSNLADSDGFEEMLDDAGIDEIRHYVDGGAAYLHAEYDGLFFDAEYMTALDEFKPDEVARENGDGAEPRVWNFEAGYNWNWGKNLEIALKYAGSDEAEALGFPEDRYGINFNQELFDGVTASVGYLHDEYESADPDDRDERDMVFAQIAVQI